MSSSAHSQLFQNPFSSTEKSNSNNLLVKLLEEYETLDGSQSRGEERYQQLSIEVERQLDLNRTLCAESGGKEDKQRCFRELLGYHRRFLEKSFDFKKALLKRLHESQFNALDEARAKALKELERTF